MDQVVPFNIAEGIITKLGSLAINDIAQSGEVKDEMEKLKSTVQTITAVLLEAEKQSLQSDRIKGWLGDLKEALYDADDLLDVFSTEIFRQQVVQDNKMVGPTDPLLSSSNKLAYGLKMAHKIKGIRARLDLIADDRKFHLVQPHNGSSHNEEHHNNNCQNKITVEQILVIINFILELPTAVFDQLSLVNKPRYALASLLISFAVLSFCIIELVYIGRKKRVTWGYEGRIPWFYHSTPDSKCFGTFPDIVGMVCAIFQCIFTAITYAFLSHQVDNPIKISFWPIIFSFGLLCSKFMKSSSRNRGIPREIDP